MSKAFLSYSSKDKEYVEKIANKFGSNRVIYGDFSFEIGGKTLEEILKGLSTADLFVVFLSESALESHWVREELNMAYSKLSLGEIKRIFPIIIDNKITHNDPRIPRWLTSGELASNIRPIDNPLVAYRKIDSKLKELSSEYNDSEVSYVGHEKELSDFHNLYYSAETALTGIIAAGFQGIGRTTFIRQCLSTVNLFQKTYSPIIIDFNRDQSLEDLIYKLVEAGYGRETIQSVSKLNYSEKIKCLVQQLKQIQNMQEFVIFKDNGGLISDLELVDWFSEAVAQIRSELTFGIVSSRHVNANHLKQKSRYFCVDINELDTPNKLRLLQQYSGLDREETRYFSDSLSGHPVQIKYCAELIREIGLEETKRSTNLLTEFSFKSAKQIINSSINILSLTTAEDKETFMGYLAFLAQYPNVPTELVLRVNQKNPLYEKIFRNFISLCICQRIGTTKDIISTAPLICDYIDRNGIEMASDIKAFLKIEFKKFQDDLSKSNLDEYCYSQLDYNLKTMIIDEKNFYSTCKFLYPSVIVRAVIEMYNSQKYNRVIELCSANKETSQLWDAALLNTFYYYFCMALAHKQEKKLLEIVTETCNNKNILDKNQIDFVVGFYYKFIHKFDDALWHFRRCIKNSPRYTSARRELVEVFITLEDYNAALSFAKKNYMDYPDNVFNIFQYYKCCIHAARQDVLTIDKLIKELEKYEELIPNSRQFYPEARTLYFQFIKKDLDGAIKFLKTHSVEMGNKMYYYKNLFDLYEEKKDLKKMQETYEELKKAINTDQTYAPILVRRKYVVKMFEGDSLDNVLISLRLEQIGEHAQKQISRYLEHLASRL